MIDKLPWSPTIGRRCRARLARSDGGAFWGRCDLAPHLPTIDHALERGLVIVRWASPSWLDLLDEGVPIPHGRRPRLPDPGRGHEL